MNSIIKRFKQKGIGFLDIKIVIKTCIYILYSAVLLFLGIYNIFTSKVNIWLLTISLIGGLAIGQLFGRAARFTWNDEKNKIVNKSDLFGIIILVVYILFVLFRRKIFAHWFAGQQLTILSTWFTFGLILGKLKTYRRKMKIAVKDLPNER